jgi:hypothetical protein
MSLAISGHTWDYIPNIVLTPLEIVFNKPHPYILLRIKDATKQKILLLFLQEIKHDIIFSYALLLTLRRREELQHACNCLLHSRGDVINAHRSLYSAIVVN